MARATGGTAAENGLSPIVSQPPRRQSLCRAWRCVTAVQHGTGMRHGTAVRRGTTRRSGVVARRGTLKIPKFRFTLHSVLLSDTKCPSALLKYPRLSGLSACSSWAWQTSAQPSPAQGAPSPEPDLIQSSCKRLRPGRSQPMKIKHKQFIIQHKCN